MMIAVTLAIAALIAVIEVPYLVKNTFIKEVWVFSILLVIMVIISIVYDQKWIV